MYYLHCFRVCCGHQALDENPILHASLQLRVGQSAHTQGKQLGEGGPTMKKYPIVSHNHLERLGLGASAIRSPHPSIGEDYIMRKIPCT